MVKQKLCNMKQNGIVLITVLQFPFQWDRDLLRQTEELDRHIQTKDNLISKIRNESEPLIQSASRNLETVNGIAEVTIFLCLHTY